MLDVGSLGPGLCGILFQFTGSAWNIHQAVGTSREPPGPDYTQQNRPGPISHHVTWRQLLPSWVRIWRTTRWRCRLDYRNREKSAHRTLESVASNSMVDGSKTADLLVVQRVPHEPGNHWKLPLYTELWGKLGRYCLVLANSATIGHPFIPRIPWMVSQLLSPSSFRTVGSQLLVDRPWRKGPGTREYRARNSCGPNVNNDISNVIFQPKWSTCRWFGRTFSF